MPKETIPARSKLINVKALNVLALKTTGKSEVKVQSGTEKIVN